MKEGKSEDARDGIGSVTVVGVKAAGFGAIRNPLLSCENSFSLFYLEGNGHLAEGNRKEEANRKGSDI